MGIFRISHVIGWRKRVFLLTALLGALANGQLEWPTGLVSFFTHG